MPAAFFARRRRGIAFSICSPPTPPATVWLVGWLVGWAFCPRKVFHCHPIGNELCLPQAATAYFRGGGEELFLRQQYRATTHCRVLLLFPYECKKEPCLFNIFITCAYLRHRHRQVKIYGYIYMHMHRVFLFPLLVGVANAVFYRGR